jgi:DNA repair protein RadC
MSKSPAKNKNIFADFNPPTDISYTTSPVNSAQNADKNTEKIPTTPLPFPEKSPFPFPENSPLPLPEISQKISNKTPPTTAEKNATTPLPFPENSPLPLPEISPKISNKNPPTTAEKSATPLPSPSNSTPKTPAKKPQNPHAGHRERMRERFLSDYAHFADHELLELLLFYAKVNGDTNELAHALINRCGSFSDVFVSDYTLLQDITGMGKSSVVLVKLFSQIMLRYHESVLIKEHKNNFYNLGAYFKVKFSTETMEKVMCVAFDNDLNISSCAVISSGSLSVVPIDLRKIVKFAYQANTNLIAIAHNHPNGDPMPSEEDISATRYLVTTLRPVDVVVLDHIIVGGDRFVSLKQHGAMFFI